MERVLLTAIGWKSQFPTGIHFLRRFSKAADATSETHTMSKYLLELGLLDSTLIGFKRSRVAAAAVLHTRKMYGVSPAWTECLRHHTSYAETELVECAKRLKAEYAQQRTAKRQFNCIRDAYAAQYGVSKMYEKNDAVTYA
jgi:hypothetical protein